MQFHVFPRRRLASRYWCALVVTVFALVDVAIVSAAAGATTEAPWTPGLETPFVSRVEPTIVDEVTRVFELSPEERASVQVVVDEHRATFAAFTERAQPVQERWDQKKAEAATTWDRWEVMVESQSQLIAIADEQWRLDKNLLDAINRVLPERARQRWPQFIYDRQQVVWPALAMFAEEDVDLPRLIREHVRTNELSEEVTAHLQQLISDYLVEAVAARQEVIERYVVRRRIEVGECAPYMSLTEWGQLMNSLPPLSERPQGRRRVEGLVKAHERVRTLNRDLVRNITTILPQSGDVTTAYLHFAVAAAGQRWPLDERYDLMETVLNLPDLTEGQSKRIPQIAGDLHHGLIVKARALLDAFDELQVAIAGLTGGATSLAETVSERAGALMEGEEHLQQMILLQLTDSQRAAVRPHNAVSRSSP